MHRRSVGAKYGTSSIGKLKAKGINAEVIYTKDKYKYIYPLTKELKDKCLELKKPYPKTAWLAYTVMRCLFQDKEGVQFHHHALI